MVIRSHTHKVLRAPEGAYTARPAVAMKLTRLSCVALANFVQTLAGLGASFLAQRKEKREESRKKVSWRECQKGRTREDTQKITERETYRALREG